MLTWTYNKMPPPSVIIPFKSSYETLISRLNTRAIEEQRMDDTNAIFTIRYCIYQEKTIPLLEYLERNCVYKMETVDSDKRLSHVLDKIYAFSVKMKFVGAVCFDDNILLKNCQTHH